MNNSTKTGKYRCTGAHSTKKCAVGVVEAISVSNIINYIENPYNELQTHTVKELHWKLQDSYLISLLKLM